MHLNRQAEAPDFKIMQKVAHRFCRYCEMHFGCAMRGSQNFLNPNRIFQGCGQPQDHTFFAFGSGGTQKIERFIDNC
jgi:hypothetical protein